MRYKQLLIRGSSDPRFPKRHLWNKCRKKREKSRKNRHFRAFSTLHPLKGSKKISPAGPNAGGRPPRPPLRLICLVAIKKKAEYPHFAKTTVFGNFQPIFPLFTKMPCNSISPLASRFKAKFQRRVRAALLIPVSLLGSVTRMNEPLISFGAALYIG